MPTYNGDKVEFLPDEETIILPFLKRFQQYLQGNREDRDENSLGPISRAAYQALLVHLGDQVLISFPHLEQVIVSEIQCILECTNGHTICYSGNHELFQ